MTRSQIDFVPGTDARILLLSMRQVADLVGFCPLYEFEDTLVELTGADMVMPAGLDGLEFSRRIYKLARYITRSPRLADRVTPRAAAVSLEKSYDLFLAFFNHPHELFALNAVKGWRQRCRSAVCYINEVWEHQLPGYLVELLRDFDHIFLGMSHPTPAVARISGRPCTYMPLGADALKFCPYPNPPLRPIDVCGIGRRSPVTHAALLELARQTGFFYFYDTVQSKPAGKLAKQLTFRVSNIQEHRLLLANLLKRSRYFIANRARANELALTRGKDEIAARFFEGAASGAIMLGEPPNTEEFRKRFGWPDAVIPIPFDAPRVAEVIAELDADPARVSRIREDNVVNTLLQHDWLYRLRTVLSAVGIAPTEPMLAREALVKTLAEEIRRAPTAAS